MSESAVIAAKPVLTRDSPLTDVVKVWLDTYDSGRAPVSQVAIRARMRFFTDYFPGRKVSEFTRDDIAAWVRYMHKERTWHGKVGSSGNTVRHRLKIISGFFRWCFEDQLIDRNPVQWRRLPTIPRELTRRVPFNFEQYQKILAESRDPKKYHEFWPSAIIIAWHTGLRMKDVAHLRWTHDENGGGSAVDFENEIIVARPMKRSAVRQRLEIPIEADLYEHLMELNLNRRFENSPFVLPLMHGRSIGRRDLSAMFRNMCDRAGLTDLSFHSFRHGFVTRLINAGADAITIGSMTGQSAEQVREYCHISTEAKRAALENARHVMHQASLRRSGVGPARTLDVTPTNKL